MSSVIHGYPIDLRSNEQRRRAAADSTTGDFEWAAARVVARLTGEMVLIIDNNQSAHTPDLRIDYGNREPGYVEIVRDIDKRYAQMWAMVVRGGLDTDVSVLGRAWQVSLSHVTRRKPQLLLCQLVPLLQSMEKAGEVYESVVDRSRLMMSSTQHAVALLKLGVVGVGSRKLADDETLGHIRFVPEGITGPIEPDWTRFLEWVQTYLSSESVADVRLKLHMSGAVERHAFIGTSYTSPGEVFFALSMDHVGVVPSEPPTLPPEVTHLWVWNQSQDRCIAWLPDRGWLDVQQHWGYGIGSRSTQ